MAKPKTNQTVTNTNASWILIILLVAGSSFMLGSSFNQPTTSEPSPNTPTAADSSVISDISQTLQTPSGASVTDSSPASVSAITVSDLVSINTGTQAQLETLPGIGPSKAGAIITYRTENGPFIRLEDLEKVKGIGPKTFASLKSKISL